MSRHERERARAILRARDNADRWTAEIGLNVPSGWWGDYEDMADDEKDTP